MHASAQGQRALPIFFVTGLLMGFPGAILPAWGHHLRDDFSEASQYFLAMFLGLLASFFAGDHLVKRRSVRFGVILGCAVATSGFLWLALTLPPMAWWWRAPGVLLLGLSAGLLNSGAFQAISPIYEQDAAATVNLAGILFGLGCFVMSLLVSGAFYVYTVASTLVLLALIPAMAAGLYRKIEFARPAGHVRKPLGAVWAEVRSPGAVLFSLLLFFQFANEWTVAGWLAVFLGHRVGLNPEQALRMLAAYWLALIVGRIASQALLDRVGHFKLLLSGTAAACFGCLVLTLTNNAFGAWVGLLTMGLGFAVVYPLVVERIGHRFPNYHPGFFNGLVSIGVVGGLLAPWVVGYAASTWGIAVVMVMPLAGSFVVAALTLLLWLETRLTAG